MKKLLLVLMSACFALQLFSQDIIKLKDNSELKVNIVEVKTREISYKMTDLPDGPVISIKKNVAESIIFRNGTRDNLGYQNPRKYKPIGIGADFFMNLGEEELYLMGITADYFIIPQVKIEVTAGTDAEDGIYLSGGPLLFLNSSWSSSKLVPFIGAKVGTYSGNDYLQIPAGIDLQLKSGFNAALSIGYLDFYNNSDYIVIEIKAGWRFRI